MAVTPVWPAEPVGVAQPATRIMQARRPSVLVVCNRETHAAGRRCTTRQHNAHRTEEREVFYPWHPWFGLRVFVYEVVTRGSARAFRCAETAQIEARCLEVPEWMFDRTACCGVKHAESPRVDRAALDRLKALR